MTAYEFFDKITGGAMPQKPRTVKEKQYEPVAIAEMLDEGAKLPDRIWGHYAFYSEPLKNKVGLPEKEQFIVRANECGVDYANRILEENPDLTVEAIAEKLGIVVKRPSSSDGGAQGNRILFSQFVSPNEISIFVECLKKAELVIDKNSLQSFFDGIVLGDILLAHEIFHFLEHQEKKSIFTKTQKIDLWSFKLIPNRSGLVCLGEIAAMAFTKRLLSLAWSPYILDIFLVYLYNENASYGLYNRLMRLKNSLPPTS